MPKLTDLTKQLSVAPDDGDLMHIVDVSDTTEDPAGTSKKITNAKLLAKTVLLAGRSGGQTIDGSTLTTETLSLRNNAVDDDGIDVLASGEVRSNNATYETLVTNDDTLTNKKFVDDEIAKTVLLAGRSGGQTIDGSTLTAETLSLRNNAVDDQGINILAGGEVRSNNLTYEALVTNDETLTNKKYVDNVRANSSFGMPQDFHFSDTAEGIIATYNLMYPEITGGVESTVSAAIVGASTTVQTWITEITEPMLELLSSGNYRVRISAAITAGTKGANLRARVWYRSTGGGETILGSSELSSNLTGTKTIYDLDIERESDKNILLTDRLIVRTEGNPVGGGTDPTVTLYLEGTTNSRLEAKVSTRYADFSRGNETDVNVSLAQYKPNTTTPVSLGWETAVAGVTTTISYGLHLKSTDALKACGYHIESVDKEAFNVTSTRAATTDCFSFIGRLSTGNLESGTRRGYNWDYNGTGEYITLQNITDAATLDILQVSKDGSVKFLNGVAVNISPVTTSTYTVLITDEILHVTRTATGACAITFPTAVLNACEGTRFAIKDAGFLAATNNITLLTEGAQTIDGEASLVISSNKVYLPVYVYGGNLFID